MKIFHIQIRLNNWQICPSFCHWATEKGNGSKRRKVLSMLNSSTYYSNLNCWAPLGLKVLNLSLRVSESWIGGSAFYILSFDIYVDICGCLPNYCSLWKYFDILHFNIRFKGHETQMLPHTKNNNDVVSLKYCFICYNAVIQIILNCILDVNYFSKSFTINFWAISRPRL